MGPLVLNGRTLGPSFGGFFHSPQNRGRSQQVPGIYIYIQYIIYEVLTGKYTRYLGNL